MFDPYHKWLGIHKKYRPLTLYRLLGIDPAETDVEVIEEAAIRQISHLRAYQSGDHADVCARVMEEIAKAREILTTPEKRRAYDTKLARLRKKPVDATRAKQSTNNPSVPNSNNETTQIKAVESSPFADLFEQNVVVAPTTSTTVTPLETTDVLPQVEARKPVGGRKKGLPIGLIGGVVGLVIVVGIVLGVMFWPRSNNTFGPNGEGLEGAITLTARSTAKGTLLEWNEIPGAKYYEVQRGGSESGPWITLIERRTTNQFVDVSGGGSVWYRVRASDGNNWGVWASFFASQKKHVGSALIAGNVKHVAGAYSLRKLVPSYQGSAIRVRRSSDNSQKDIGFFKDQLDEVALSAFVGNGNGYVSIWYDQSRKGRDAIQKVSAEQPVVMKAGTIVQEAPSFGLLFEGNNRLIVDGINEDIEGGVNLLVVCRPTAKNYCVLNTNDNDSWWSYHNGEGSIGAFLGNRINGYPSPVPKIGRWAVWTVSSSPNNYEVFLNGISTGRKQSQHVPGERMVIGGPLPNSKFSRWMTGYLSEIVLLDVSIDQNILASIEDELISFHQIEQTLKED